jgi:hypothetical protein
MAVKKKILGYGFKLAGEKVEKAMTEYYSGGYMKSRNAVKGEIQEAIQQGYIGRSAKPQIFRVVVEIECKRR